MIEGFVGYKTVSANALKYREEFRLDDRWQVAVRVGHQVIFARFLEGNQQGGEPEIEEHEVPTGTLVEVVWTPDAR